MPVTREEVDWAYRMFLGRDVENEGQAQGHMLLPDRDTLRRVFMGSAEFVNVAHGGSSATVGAYQDVKSIPVDVNCTDEQRRRLLAHIAAEWRKYGAEAPHWSVLTGDEFKPENIDENIEEFYATGRRHVEVMLNPLSRSHIPVDRFSRVMDFGCGLGRLTLAIAPIADEIIGVDISPPHIELARMRAGPGSNARFVSIDTVEEIAGLGSFELIISFIVLQHNPPPVMAAILKRLLSCLARKGCILIQIPTYIDGYSFRVEDYLVNPNAGIAANPLPQHEIFRIFADAGCDILEVRQDDFLGAALSHTFAAQKR